MAFRHIEQIKIGNNPNGQAYGGFIYELKVNLGFGGTPSVVTVNVINEDGLYKISSKDLSVIDPLSIKIMRSGSSDQAQLELPSMYLVEYNYRQSAGSKILSLEFVDRSIFLGKIWVGLAGKTAMPHNLVPPEDGQRMIDYRDKGMGAFNTVKIPIRCAPCSKYIPGIIPLTPQPMQDVQFATMQYPSSAGWASNVDPEKGGAIILGADEFTSNSCEIADVKYNWEELVYVMEKNNIFVSKTSTGQPSIHNRGKHYYRAQHANQTLNKIISSWCQDLGFEWGWDPFNNKIYGRDRPITIMLV